MLELIIGGARSGKSHYALHAAQTAARGAWHFVATAAANDAEMAARIKQHQAVRDPRWQVHAVQHDLAHEARTFKATDVVVVDCLTLWVANWLAVDENDKSDGAAWRQEKHDFLAALRASPANWYLVSNETGLGITPLTPLARQFIDESGLLHQELAAMAERVTVVMCGIARSLKDEGGVREATLQPPPQYDESNND